MFTGTRAEYGLLYWTLREIDNNPDLDLLLFVSGTHLAPQFGRTVSAIEQDGFQIAACVDLKIGDDSPLATAKTLGYAVTEFAENLDRLHPDLVLLLGDRYEALAMAEAAMMLRIPIAHMHGGERTEGLIDEAVRHSITKMAHVHFCAAEPYRRRILQLGELPERVFNVGAPVIENLRRQPLLSREDLECKLGATFSSPLFSVTYHPVTLKQDDQEETVAELCRALARFPESTVVITGTNADSDHNAITQLFEAFVRRHPGPTVHVPSLGTQGYLSLIKHADAVIGNSSSGLIEAPAVGTPTVNIGPRQQGRIRSASVIDCGDTATAIEAAIRLAVDPDFVARAKSASLPFGKGDTSALVVDVLRKLPLDGILMKQFQDQPDDAPVCPP